MSLPGAVCGASHPIRLRDGRGFVSPIPRRFAHDFFYGKHAVEVGAHGVSYGHLDATSEDAGLQVVCTNGGGTADGQLLWSDVIFRLADHGPSVVGILTPRVQLAGEHPTILDPSIMTGRVVVHEYFYGPFDGTCCSSGRATTVWRYVDGLLLPGSPVINRRPRARIPGQSLAQPPEERERRAAEAELSEIESGAKV